MKNIFRKMLAFAGLVISATATAFGLGYIPYEELHTLRAHTMSFLEAMRETNWVPMFFPMVAIIATYLMFKSRGSKAFDEVLVVLVVCGIANYAISFPMMNDLNKSWDPLHFTTTNREWAHSPPESEQYHSPPIVPRHPR